MLDRFSLSAATIDQPVALSLVADQDACYSHNLSFLTDWRLQPPILSLWRLHFSHWVAHACSYANSRHLQPQMLMRFLATISYLPSIATTASVWHLLHKAHPRVSYPNSVHANFLQVDGCPLLASFVPPDGQRPCEFLADRRLSSLHIVCSSCQQFPQPPFPTR